MVDKVTDLTGEALGFGEFVKGDRNVAVIREAQRSLLMEPFFEITDLAEAGLGKSGFEPVKGVVLPEFINALGKESGGN